MKSHANRSVLLLAAVVVSISGLAEPASADSRGSHRSSSVYAKRSYSHGHHSSYRGHTTYRYGKSTYGRRSYDCGPSYRHYGGYYGYRYPYSGSGVSFSFRYGSGYDCDRYGYSIGYSSYRPSYSYSTGYVSPSVVVVDRGATGVQTYPSYTYAARTPSQTPIRVLPPDEPEQLPTYVEGEPELSSTPTAMNNAVKPDRRRIATIDIPDSAAEPRSVMLAEDGPKPDRSRLTMEELLAAWDLLGEGQFKEAQRRFAIACEVGPAQATAKAGYAISALMMGQKQTAAWAMRRAFAADAEAIGFIPQSEALRDRLESLADGLAEQAGVSDAPDDWFLLAAVQFLRHDVDSARPALEQAVEAGDGDLSTVALADQLGLALESD